MGEDFRHRDLQWFLLEHCASRFWGPCVVTACSFSVPVLLFRVLQRNWFVVDGGRLSASRSPVVSPRTLCEQVLGSMCGDSVLLQCSRAALSCSSKELVCSRWRKTFGIEISSGFS